MQPQWEDIKGTSYPNGKSSHKAVLGYSLEVHPSPRYAAQGQLTSKLKALVKKRAVQPVDDTRRSFICPTFSVPKGDGS